jgi:hypothetical protein
MPIGFDPSYLLWVMIPSLILSLGAQFLVRNAYSKWSRVRNSSNASGVNVAQIIQQNTTVRGVGVEAVRGQLTDHYDPRTHTIRLSEGNDDEQSVAAMAIVAHELGHAQQHQEGSPLIQARNFLVPAVQISPTIGYLMIVGGLMLGFMQLFWLGVGVFSIMVIFMILTLPVEFDASARGLKLLEQSGLMQTEQDRQGSKAVLTAAALTYIAAAIGAVLQLLYFISMASRRR